MAASITNGTRGDPNNLTTNEMRCQMWSCVRAVNFDKGSLEQRMMRQGQNTSVEIVLSLASMFVNKKQQSSLGSSTGSRVCRMASTAATLPVQSRIFLPTLPDQK
eukprot:6485887-Amphidinium_carterae.3